MVILNYRLLFSIKAFICRTKSNSNHLTMWHSSGTKFKYLSILCGVKRARLKRHNYNNIVAESDRKIESDIKMTP